MVNNSPLRIPVFDFRMYPYKMRIERFNELLIGSGLIKFQNVSL